MLEWIFGCLLGGIWIFDRPQLCQPENDTLAQNMIFFGITHSKTCHTLRIRGAQVDSFRLHYLFACFGLSFSIFEAPFPEYALIFEKKSRSPGLYFFFFCAKKSASKHKPLILEELGIFKRHWQIPRQKSSPVFSLRSLAEGKRESLCFCSYLSAKNDFHTKPFWLSSNLMMLWRKNQRISEKIKRSFASINNNEVFDAIRVYWNKLTDWQDKMLIYTYLQNAVIDNYRAVWFSTSETSAFIKSQKVVVLLLKNFKPKPA